MRLSMFSDFLAKHATDHRFHLTRGAIRYSMEGNPPTAELGDIVAFIKGQRIIKAKTKRNNGSSFRYNVQPADLVTILENNDKSLEQALLTKAFLESV